MSTRLSDFCDRCGTFCPGQRCPGCELPVVVVRDRSGGWMEGCELVSDRVRDGYRNVREAS